MHTNQKDRSSSSNESPWLTISEAADYLRLYNKKGDLNISYIYKLVSSGLLIPYKLGKFNRYKREDLDTLLIKEGT